MASEKSASINIIDSGTLIYKARAGGMDCYLTTDGKIRFTNGSVFNDHPLTLDALQRVVVTWPSGKAPSIKDLWVALAPLGAKEIPISGKEMTGAGLGW